MSWKSVFTAASAALCIAGLAFGQPTNPAPRSVPFTEDFGTAVSSTAPTGFAAWNGVSGGSTTSQGAAEASNPTGDATILTTNITNGGTGGAYSNAVGSNVRLAVVQSSNATNGVNQWVFAINTTGQSSMTLSYDLIYITAQATRGVGVVAQYRVGHTGTWNTLPSVTGNPYVVAGGGAAAGDVTHVSIPLPSALNNNAEVQIRFANWRPTGSGNSVAFGIDNVSVMTAGVTTGACCSSGLCTTVPQASCSGTYQGDNTSCSPNPCPQVIGACCINGACVVDSSQASCLANGTGSSWGGAGTTCATFACSPATGSCCAADGTCTTASQNDCSGVFTANGSCTPNLCDDGACCNPAAGTCFLAFDQASCTARNGNFIGFGTVCTSNPCPAVNGACCTAGVCTLTGDGLGCRAGGGVYLGVGTACTPTGCNRATGANLVAKYDFDVNVVGGGSRNLTFTTSVNPPFPTGDQFGVAQRYVDPNLPFGLLDDSVFIFNGDTQGVIPESKVDSWFGVVDLFDQIVPNNPGTATATWTFDITGFTNLNLAIDAAAMGDFELAPIADFFTFTVSIDGGAPVTVFTAGADESATQSYTMANGVVVNLDDPFVVTGSTTSPLTLTNVFQTLSANIAGTGSTLTLTLTAFGDGADEAYAFDNITITGTPVAAQTGACCVSGVCSVVTQAACSGAYQGNGTACTPSPCAPVTGACCCGSHCSLSTQAACSGTNTSFAGGSTACQPGNTPCCRGDYNKSGAPASVQDIFDFLAGYFTVSECADTNDSGTISVQDIFDFLSAYFGGGC